MQNYLSQAFVAFLRCEDGLTSVEYAIIVTGILVLCFAAAITLGSHSKPPARPLAPNAPRRSPVGNERRSGEIRSAHPVACSLAIAHRAASQTSGSGSSSAFSSAGSARRSPRLPSAIAALRNRPRRRVRHSAVPR